MTTVLRVSNSIIRHTNIGIIKTPFGRVLDKGGFEVKFKW